MPVFNGFQSRLTEEASKSRGGEDSAQEESKSTPTPTFLCSYQTSTCPLLRRHRHSPRTGWGSSSAAEAPSSLGWVPLRSAHGEDQEIRQIPQGHCWVEGDNAGVSMDSRFYGPVSLFLPLLCLLI